MFFRYRTSLRRFLACTAILPITMNSVSAQDAAPDVIKLVPKVEPAEFARPGVLPDRIILTWASDPSTSQAVTWRTSTVVTRGLAEITIANAGPDLESKSKQLVALSQPLTTDLNNGPLPHREVRRTFAEDEVRLSSWRWRELERMVSVHHGQYGAGAVFFYLLRRCSERPAFQMVAGRS